MIAVYVDDLLIFRSDLDAVNGLKKDFNTRFEMTDLGEAHYCLRIQITRDRTKGAIQINQTKYIENILQRFNMQDCKPAATPMQSGIRLSKKMSPSNDKELEDIANVPYQNTVGSIMYAMLGTRPDIAYAVGAVSQFNANPGQGHWKAVKWILRYLQGTKDHCLQYT